MTLVQLSDLVEAKHDTVAPPDKMLRPLADKLEAESDRFEYVALSGNHSFIGQRMKLTKVVGEWIERKVSLRG